MRKKYRTFWKWMNGIVYEAVAGAVCIAAMISADAIEKKAGTAGKQITAVAAETDETGEIMQEITEEPGTETEAGTESEPNTEWETDTETEENMEAEINTEAEQADTEIKLETEQEILDGQVDAKVSLETETVATEKQPNTEAKSEPEAVIPETVPQQSDGEKTPEPEPAIAETVSQSTAVEAETEPEPVISETASQRTEVETEPEPLISEVVSQQTELETESEPEALISEVVSQQTEEETEPETEAITSEIVTQQTDEATEPEPEALISEVVFQQTDEKTESEPETIISEVVSQQTDEKTEPETEALISETVSQQTEVETEPETEAIISETVSQQTEEETEPETEALISELVSQQTDMETEYETEPIILETVSQQADTEIESETEKETLEILTEQTNTKTDIENEQETVALVGQSEIEYPAETSKSKTIKERIKPETEPQTELHEIEGSKEQTESETEPQTELREIESSKEQTESEIKSPTEADETETSGKQTDSEVKIQKETGTVEVSQEQNAMETNSNEALRGTHYEVRGEDYAWYRDSNDRLWIRKDSTLIVEALGTDGYNRGIQTRELKENGSVRFQLEQVDDTGAVLAESSVAEELYYIDGDAPSADISVDGTVAENQIFSPQGKISILIPPDAESGLKQAAYCIVPCTSEGSNMQEVGMDDWKICGEQEYLEWTSEGTYRVYVRTEDQVGNVKFSQSSVFCIDRTAPSVTISGVSDQTANSGSLDIQVKCRDENGVQKLQKAEIRGLNNGMILQPEEYSDGDGSIRLIYPDFPEDQKYDDIYEMTIQVEDLAGNTSEETLYFSVNRCGSVYDLSEDTRAWIQNYYVQEPLDLVIYETNVDYVGESKIFCRRDGILQELVKGQDYQVVMTGTAESWKQYQYTISSDFLEKEGIYEILMTSTDSAKNSSDTSVQKKKMTFAVDRTPPMCTIAGIEEQGVYDSEGVDVHLLVSDNVCLKTVQIYRDSTLWKEISASELNQNGNELTVELDQRENWQTFQVYLEDASGNSCWTREIPFYLSAGIEKNNVSTYQKRRSSAEENARMQEEEAAEVNQDTVMKEKEAGLAMPEGKLLFWIGLAAFLTSFSYCGIEWLYRQKSTCRCTRTAEEKIDFSR